MLQNLGYKVGQGLGRENQGILNPIEAVNKNAYSTNYELTMNKKKKKVKGVSKKPVETSEQGAMGLPIVKKW